VTTICRTREAVSHAGIPAKPGEKAPALSWSVYVHRQPTAAEIATWARRYPVPPWNQTLVLGEAVGVVVLDIESVLGHRIDGFASLGGYELTETLAVRTSTGGTHLYYQRPPAGIPSLPAVRRGVELRGDGRCVLLPPSVVGQRPAYTWLNKLEIAPFPSWILQAAHRVEADAQPRVRPSFSPPPGFGPATVRERAERILAVCGCGASRCPCRSARIGRGLTHCPGHDDVHPSFAVNILSGRVVVHCHRQPGCAQAEVLAALALLGAWP